MQRRQLLINAFMSLAQTLSAGVLFFVLYWFLLKTIGVQKLGIWSVVLATTGAARITDLGFSMSIVKFVAKYAARGADDEISDILQTAAVSVAVLVGLVLCAGYPILSWVMTRVMSGPDLAAALSILPYAVLSLWLSGVAGVFQGGLDGYQRIDVRSGIFLVSTALYLGLAFMLAPERGLMGLAYAQLIQAGVLLVSNWYFLRKRLISLPIIPHRWSARHFREMASYGVNFQVASVSQLLSDPITKTLVAKFGSLSMVAYYEMASRMVLQFRALIISANQAIVPAVADLHEKDAASITTLYRNAYSLLIYLSVPLYAGMMTFIPVISQLWIGRYEGSFVLFSFLLSAGWFVNTLCGPAYFANLGIGDLTWNTAAHVAIGVMNVGLGYVCGRLYGGEAVVVAYVAAFVIGSSIIPLMYHRTYALPFGELFPRDIIPLAAACAAGSLTGLLIYRYASARYGLGLTAGMMAVSFAALTAGAVWTHPTRERLIQWIRKVRGS